MSMGLRRAMAVLALVGALAATGVDEALAQPPKFDIHAPIDPSRGDALSNPSYHGPEVLKFIGVKPGWKVADIFPGRFTTAIAQAAGPNGRVYGFMPEEIFKVHPGLVDLQAKRAADPTWKGIELLRAPMNEMALAD